MPPHSGFLAVIVVAKGMTDGLNGCLIQCGQMHCAALPFSIFGIIQNLLRPIQSIPIAISHSRKQYSAS